MSNVHTIAYASERSGREPTKVLASAQAVPRKRKTQLRFSGPLPAARPPEQRLPERLLAPLGPGQQIPGSRYRIVRRLGAGAMGIVYEAEHIDMERRAAVKILRPEVSDHPAVVRAFRDEARAASRIQSDFIVQLYDFADLPDGRLMIAMELLTGWPLRQELRGPLPLPRALRILRQVCQGLAAAHAAGVVHRDIKPDNIFVVGRDGRMDTVKLVDFGIAAIHDGTESNVIQGGTPNYLAPEVGTSASAAPTVDVYAFGCMAYELLTGRVPFPGPGIRKVMHAHLHQPPPRPSSREPGIPAALDALVVRCMAKDPTERFASMTEVETALCEAQLEQGMSPTWDDLPAATVELPRRDRWLARLPQLLGRNRVRSRALALVGSALMVLLAATASVLLPEPQAADALAPRSSIAPMTRAGGARLDPLAGHASGVVPPAEPGPSERAQAQADPGPVPGPGPDPVPGPGPGPGPGSVSPPDPVPASDPAPGEAPSAAVVDDTATSARRADALAREGRAAFRAGQLPRARSLLERAVALDRHHASALASLRDVAFEQADYARAVSFGERALRERPRSAKSNLRLGDAYFKVGRMADALARYERAAALGNRQADSRIRKVRHKLTGSPG